MREGRIEPNSLAGFTGFLAGFSPGSVRARGKGANTAITIVASRMATIVFHLLKEHREFTPFPPNAIKPPAAL